MITAAVRTDPPRTAFTLIEIMIVVAIIGLIAAMGVPSILQVMRKDGMRKALSDMRDVCNDARARAIFTGQTTEIDFYPSERRWQVSAGAAEAAPESPDGAPVAAPVSTTASPWKGAESGTLPDGVDFAMMDINLGDYLESPVAKVRFFRDGTCDELVLILHSTDEWQKISLEFSTSLVTVSPVTR